MLTFQLDPYHVHCHVGSLESKIDDIIYQALVHCHVGSLEIKHAHLQLPRSVHCHVGSLER